MRDEKTKHANVGTPGCVKRTSLGSRWKLRRGFVLLICKMSIFIYFKNYLFIYLFIFGCVGSLLLRVGFL